MMPVPDYSPEVAFRFDLYAAADGIAPEGNSGLSVAFYMVEPFGRTRTYYQVDVYDEDRQRVAQLHQVSPSPMSVSWEEMFFDVMWWFVHEAEKAAENERYPESAEEVLIDPVSLKWATENYMVLTAVQTMGELFQNLGRRSGHLQSAPALSDEQQETLSAVRNAFVWDLDKVTVPAEMAANLRRRHVR